MARRIKQRWVSGWESGRLFWSVRGRGRYAAIDAAGSLRRLVKEDGRWLLDGEPLEATAVEPAIDEATALIEGRKTQGETTRSN